LARRAKQESGNAIAYDRASELDPPDARAYLNRGNTWYNWKAYDKAIADYDKAIGLDPKNVAPYIYRDNAREAKQGSPK
ncbi:MAG TPA: tetratricopeptide repeat protein, partial [Isosphaeraceae bacterium]|nr:tetratricopeptide repeat protein [Isosphaeraceae bacterium]